MKTELTTLPNIGKVLAEKLREAGIETPEELAATGSRDAFRRIHAMDPSDACMHKLLALEGAVQGIRWHHLDETCKSELKLFYHQVKLR